jgi:iron(III) transport system substrate-binding protein
MVNFKDILPARMGKVRTRLALLVSVVAISGILACSERSAPHISPSGLEDKLIVYSPHGKEILSEFKEKFEKNHPETMVEFLYLPSQQCLERLRNEKDNPLADIWWGAGHTTFMAAAAENLLEPYRPSWADQVDAGCHDPEHCWYASFKSPEIIFYNRDLVSPEVAPQDWQDLIDPRWENHLLLRFPIPSDTMRAIFFGMIHLSIVQTGNEEHAYQWMLGVDRNTKEYLSGGELLFRKMAQRVGKVSVWTLSDIMMQKSRYGYPFEVVFPKSGCPELLDGIALVRKAQHPQAARAYYEFVTSATSLVRLANEPYYRIPVRNDLPTELFPEWMHRLKYHTLPLDWEQYQAGIKDWIRRWDHEIRSQGKQKT